MLQQLESCVEPEFSATALEDSFRAEQEHAEQMRAELEMQFAKTTLDFDRDWAIAYLNESLPMPWYFRLSHTTATTRLSDGSFVKPGENEWRASAACGPDTRPDQMLVTEGFPTPAEAATELVRLWNERRAIKAA